MLRAKLLQKVLCQVVSDGVSACILMDPEGSIVASGMPVGEMGTLQSRPQGHLGSDHQEKTF